MFRSLRLKTPKTADPVSAGISETVLRDAATPLSLTALNRLPEPLKARLYRGLLPVSLLNAYGIQPHTWVPGKTGHPLRLTGEAERGLVKISITHREDPRDELFALEAQDNLMNGIDLNFLVIGDPAAEKYRTDYDPEDRPTLFGTARRNLAEEARARECGLSPGQTRAGLRASRAVFEQFENFLAVLGHAAYFLEPLTYTSAWLFERRGCAYMRGHKLMDDIHREFQPGGRLHAALDGSTPFRHPEAWKTVRGRAWAIHDGILEALDARWDGLRMIKQVGRHAGVETFPQAVF
jgi:hypothetical protein